MDMFKQNHLTCHSGCHRMLLVCSHIMHVILEFYVNVAYHTQYYYLADINDSHDLFMLLHQYIGMCLTKMNLNI